MKSHKSYSESKIDKIGNAIRFFTINTPQSKTKLLKLIYLCEELSIKKYGVPFFNISFQVWKFGPVAEPIFVETSDSPSMFIDYFEIKNTSEGNFISGKGQFNDFEFSDNDMDILENLVLKYANSSAKDLVAITHRVNSPWYNEAVRRGILEELINEKITNTHFTVNLSELLDGADPIKKELYLDFIDNYGNPTHEFMLS